MLSDWLAQFDQACITLIQQSGAVVLLLTSCLGGVLISLFLGLNKTQSKSAPLRRKNKSGSSLVPFVACQVIIEPQEEEKYRKLGHIQFFHERISFSESEKRASEFHALADQRRTLRFFSTDPISEAALFSCIASAGTAPSGAHQQPWHFVVIKKQSIKQQIRELVEEAEQLNYDRRMKKTWVDDVQHLVSNLHTNDGVVNKAYLSEAPYLIIIMKISSMVDEEGKKQEVYYPGQGVGIASGLLIAALNDANFVTLTSTPMGAERKIADLCGRPSNEKVFLLLPVGFAADNATVPYRTEMELRKPLNEIMTVI